jgi:microcystin-dependent protein
MTNLIHLRSTPAVALLTSVLGMGWSSTSLACNSEPYISSICVMAWSRTPTSGFGNIYLPAAGATLPLASYQALFSLIGTTYGGNGTQNFQLPDLRGRMIVGAGQGAGLPNYNVGDKGGAVSSTLTVNNLPQHNHALSSVAPGTVTVTSAVGSLAAATSLAGVIATASGANLALNGSTGGDYSTSATDASLGSYNGTVKVYSNAAPSVAMKAGSISGSAPVSFSGAAPATTLTGAPAVTIGGATGMTGSSLPVNTLSPYLAMNYFIAVNGLYPTPN